MPRAKPSGTLPFDGHGEDESAKKLKESNQGWGKTRDGGKPGAGCATRAQGRQNFKKDGKLDEA